MYTTARFRNSLAVYITTKTCLASCSQICDQRGPSDRHSGRNRWRPAQYRILFPIRM
jgi:hypothetical protein